MNDQRFGDDATLPVGLLAVEQLSRIFESAWLCGEFPSIESSLERIGGDDRPVLLRRLVEIEIRCRSLQGQTPSVDEYQRRFPDAKSIVEDAFRASENHLASTTAPSLPETEDNSPSHGEPCLLQPGSAVGRYLVKSTLGRGGFGAVYLALDSQLNRDVAVKVPIRDVCHSPEAVRRFLHEARTVAQLNHPGIVPVYDAGQGEDGVPFAVMQFIDGRSLQQRMRLSPPLTAVESAQLIAEVAEAVGYAHKQGLVHRDLKPGNVMLNAGGSPLVTDFGLAIDESEIRRQAGTLAGTVQYMPPEQVTGDVNRLDGRADIWAIGVMLYQLLTHRLPFRGETLVELTDAICHQTPRPPRMIDESIPEPLERIILKCLAKSTEQRYSTAYDLAKDLKAFGSGGQFTAKRWLLVVAAILLVVAGIPAAASLFRPPYPSGISTPSDGGSSASEEKELSVLMAELHALRRDLGDGAFSIQNPARSELAASENAPASIGDGESVPLPAGFADLESDLNEARLAGEEEKEESLLLKATNELIDAGHYAIAERLALRMVDLAGDDPGDVPFAYGQLGLAQYRQGKSKQALASFDRVDEFLQVTFDRMKKLPDSDQVIEFRSYLARMVGINVMRMGNVHKAAGNYRLAVEKYEEAKQVLESYDRKQELTTLLLNYGGLESTHGNLVQAVAHLEQGLAIARELNDEQSEAEFLVNLGNAYSRGGESRKALEQFASAFEKLTPESDYALRSALLCNWATSLMEEGEHERARELLLQLQAIVRPGDEDSKQILKFLPALNKELNRTNSAALFDAGPTDFVVGSSK